MTAKQIKEKEAEEAILRQAQACHYGSVIEQDKRAKGRGRLS